MRNIVLNIPHSSTVGIFDDILGRWPFNLRFYRECVIRQTDCYTDILFKPDDAEIKSVVFPYSRFVCDVERLENDPLESEGQGIIYTRFKNYRRGEFTDEERNVLLGLRRNHLNRLSEALKEDSVLIDCHSFSSDYEEETDICIGFNEDWSFDAKLIDVVKDGFEEAGYKVSLNKPFSNSITPQYNYPYKSVMIEVNKKVYMHEHLCMLTFNPIKRERWHDCLNRIYQRIRMLDE